MEPYHKITTVWERDPVNQYKTLIEYAWAKPEFKYLASNYWDFTEKVDGTNIRVTYDPSRSVYDKVRFLGRSDAASIPPDLLKALDKMFPENKFGSAFDDGICLYGEGYGPKIQRGGKYRQDPGFVLFDIKIGDFLLNWPDVCDIGKRLDIDVVPHIGCGTLFEMVEIVKEGLKSKWGDFYAEGIVARPQGIYLNKRGERIITKLKHRDFFRNGAK